MSVKVDDVRSLYRNLLGREPDTGGLHSMQQKHDANEVAEAIIHSDEFVRQVVYVTFRHWIRRDPVEREIIEWTANYHRLGTVEGEWWLSYCPESTRHYSQGTDKLPMLPNQQNSMVNFRQYINDWIRRLMGRPPHSGETIAEAENGEWKRFFNPLWYGPGAEPPPKQAMHFVRIDPEAVKWRVGWNYSNYLGRMPNSHEVRIWEPHLRTADFTPYIAASPEGLAYGLRKRLAPMPPLGEASHHTTIVRE